MVCLSIIEDDTIVFLKIKLSTIHTVNATQQY